MTRLMKTVVTGLSLAKVSTEIVFFFCGFLLYLFFLFGCFLRYPEECIPSIPNASRGGGDTTPRCSGSVSQSHNTGLRPGQRRTPAVAPPGQKVFKDVNVGRGEGRVEVARADVDEGPLFRRG